MNPDTPMPPEGGEQEEPASVGANAENLQRAQQIAGAVFTADIAPEEARQVRQDAKARRRPAKANPKKRKLAAMGPAGRARQRVRTGEKPMKGKRKTAAKAKPARKAQARKLHGQKKAKSTRGSPKSARRVRNRR